jgi:hypothetical protein
MNMLHEARSFKFDKVAHSIEGEGAVDDSWIDAINFGEGAQKSRSQAAPGSTEEGHLKVTLADDEGFENARKLLRDFSLHIADTMADDNRFEQM